VALRWLSVISLPILIVALLITIAGSGPQNYSPNSTGINFSGLPLVLVVFLNITADLPTYFRHSRSWADSVGALSATQIGFFLISFGCLFLGSKIEGLLGTTADLTNFDTSMFYRLFLIVLIFLSATCANVWNVYSSSVGWELVAPILAGVKEYLILGLGLTTISILILKDISMGDILNITHASFTNLCLVLIMGYVFHKIMKKPLDTFSKATYFIAWLTATAINIFQYFKVSLLNISNFSSGMLTVLLIVGVFFSLKEWKVLICKK
jgi:cytosine permease